MKYPHLIILVLTLSLGVAVAQPTQSISTNISGTWEVTIERASGPVNDKFVFKQEGEKLSGTYSGSFFEHKFNGTVKANKVVFTWDQPADAGKLPPAVTFNGTLQSSTKMTGTVGIPFAPEGQTCKWTATRKEEKK